MPKGRGKWIGIGKWKGKGNGQGKGELPDKGSLIKDCIVTTVNYFRELFSDNSCFISSVGTLWGVSYPRIESGKQLPNPKVDSTPQ